MHDVVIEACHTYFDESHYYAPPSLVIPGLVIKEKILGVLRGLELDIAVVHYIDNYNEVPLGSSSGYWPPIDREVLYGVLSPDHVCTQREMTLKSSSFFMQIPDRKNEESWQKKRWYVVTENVGEIDLETCFKSRKKPPSYKYSCGLTSMVWLLTKLGMVEPPSKEFIPGKCSITILPRTWEDVETQSKELAGILGYQDLPNLTVYFPSQNRLADMRYVRNQEELESVIERLAYIPFEPDLDSIKDWVCLNVV
ncbi:MAG: hypothetical protein ISS48_03890 [Candidatus Aenigmarchaeota archaeon]|nr:hypothetical protein [Candidatus Aenigmarchaeota archaeon]